MKSSKLNLNMLAAKVDADAPNQSRREFLCAWFRYPVLAGLATLGVTLLARKKGSIGSQTCYVSPACQNCSLFGGCDQPQATEARKLL